MKKNNQQSGFSLIELMVVLVILPVLAIIATQSLITTLSTQRKIESETNIRKEIEYILTYMDRKIVNSHDLTCANGATTNTVDFLTLDGVNQQFICTFDNSLGGSAGNVEFVEDVSAGTSYQISSSQINISKCDIVCDPGGVGIPPGLDITIAGTTPGQLSEESGNIEITTKIYSRAY